MKTKNITGEGIVGISVELNIMDQHSVSAVLAHWQDMRKAKEAYNAWGTKRSKDNYWNMDTEERAKWNTENPEPTYCSPDFWEEIQPIEVFLKKIAAPASAAATIFCEDSEDE